MLTQSLRKLGIMSNYDVTLSSLGILYDDIYIISISVVEAIFFQSFANVLVSFITVRFFGSPFQMNGKKFKVCISLLQ